MAILAKKNENEARERLPIYIGRCQASNHLLEKIDTLINDGYVIEINPDSIHLLGKNDLATRFAVYGFLEDYIGVHWFLPEIFGEGFPENMGTVIPQKETIILEPTVDIQDPSFKYRMIGWEKFPWTIQNKMNFIDINKDDHGFQINRFCYSPRSPRICHTLGYFVTPEEYCDYPEYFAMVDGKRKTREQLLEYEICDPKAEDVGKIKFNLGNPELRSAMVNEVLTYIDENPEIDLISLFPDDWLGFDESEESKAMDGENYMNYTVEMVNEKGRALGEEFGRVLSKRYTMFYYDITESVLLQKPETLLMTAAYSAYQHSPMEVNDPAFVSVYKMNKNIILLITHGHEHNHPIVERSTTPN